MFWMRSLSTASPVDTVLDKDEFTLEELLDEEEIIQECKALNSRLINFLRDRAQVEQLLRYVIEEAHEDDDSKRTFKFPFIACEIFTCEIDVILKTLVEEVELMDLLFSFLEPNRPHSTLLAGYFSKVVVCLMLRKTVPLMNYVQSHHEVFQQLVDLIGITSIMEVLIRLVGADDHVYPNFLDVMQWLADSSLLEMIVDKLSPSDSICASYSHMLTRSNGSLNFNFMCPCSPEVHANAAETLCAITRNAPSALATKLSSPRYVERIFGHALEDSDSKSSLVHSLSVCTSLLDPKRSAFSSPFMHSFRSQHMFEPQITVNPETISAMLPKLGDLLVLLNLSSDDKVLLTTYGELRPPLGKYRLKIVEFLAVLLKTGNEAAEKELVCSGTIQRVLDLFFEYPFNNALHHHVESIIMSCLESKNDIMVDHLLQDCDLIGKILRTDKNPSLSGVLEQPTLPASGKQAPRVGNLGHITRISNKLVQLGSIKTSIQGYLQENNEWNEWQSTILQERNMLENVYRWACGRPTALHDRTRDSDEEDLHDRDYDVAALANDLSQAIGMKMYGHEDGEEDDGALDRDEEDVYFDDESAEVVISSLKLGDDQGSSLFTNSNWFAFQDDRIGDAAVGPSPSELMEEISLNGNSNGGNFGSDDEVVVGEEDELTENKESANSTSTSQTDFFNGFSGNVSGDFSQQDIKLSMSHDLGLYRFDTTNSNEDLFGDRPLPDWVGWGEEESDLQVGRSKNPFIDPEDTFTHQTSQVEVVSPNDTSSSPLPNGTATSTDSSDGSGLVNSDGTQKSAAVPSLFEEDVEFVGMELEGTEKAMDQALKEGIVGEAGPLKRNLKPKLPEIKNPDDTSAGVKEFNEANYWRVDQEVTVLE